MLTNDKERNIVEKEYRDIEKPDDFLPEIQRTRVELGYFRKSPICVTPQQEPFFRVMWTVTAKNKSFYITEK